VPTPAPEPLTPSRPEPSQRVATSVRISDGKRRSLPYVVAGLLVLLAIAVIAVVLASGGDGGGGGEAADRPDTAAQQERQRERDQAGENEGREQQAEPAPTPAPEPEAEEAPAEPAPAPEPAPEQQEPPADEPASGAELNAQGFELMNAGRYDEAIPILQQAVDSLAGTGSLDYAYALYNLGRSLRLAGRPDEAIPVLEQRLTIPNQRGVVKRELEAARSEAGQG
jgi:eukaryotic-like serine/threonine-protein kinase